MYKLAIIEDEKILLDDLVTNFDWESWGVELVFTERNGAIALKTIASQNVDIVLTDIRMPVMDGIEMSERMYRDHPNLQFIFLTGYDDIQYVKSAIKVNAVDYVNKPVREERLQDAIAEACRRLRVIDHAQIGHKRILEQHLAQMALDEDNAVDYFPRLPNFSAAQIVGFASIENTRSVSEVKWIVDDVKQKLLYFLSCRTGEAVVSYLSKGMFAILCDGEYDFSGLKEWEYRELQQSMGKGVSVRVLSPRKRYDGAARLYLGFMDVQNQAEGAFYPDNAQPGAPGEDHCKLRRQLLDETTVLSKDLLDTYFHSVAAEKPGRDTVQVECYDICSALYRRFYEARKAPADVSAEKSEILQAIREMESLAQLREYTIALFENGRSHTADSIETTDAKTVSDILSYIDHNFEKPISAESMVEMYYIASNTIRSIFKRHTGSTIHEYLTEKRMQQAIKLLVGTRMKIKEVSQSVGYDNVSYFCMRFAKLYNLSPLAYRKKHIGINWEHTHAADGEDTQ